MSFLCSLANALINFLLLPFSCRQDRLFANNNESLFGSAMAERSFYVANAFLLVAHGRHHCAKSSRILHGRSSTIPYIVPWLDSHLLIFVMRCDGSRNVLAFLVERLILFFHRRAFLVINRSEAWKVGLFIFEQGIRHEGSAVAMFCFI